MLTKYTEDHLNGEIDKEIEAAHNREQMAHPGWITHAICRRHIAGLAVDADPALGPKDRVVDVVEPIDVAYWRYGGYTTTRHAVTARINERGRAHHGDERARDPFLPGFDYLQRSYVIERDGTYVEVPTAKLTHDELLAKADQYDANARTMSLHAQELRRYAAQRDEEATA